MILIILIYILVCLIWGIFAIYKNNQYSIKPTIKTQLIVFVINFFLFPYTFIYSIKNKKF